MANVTPSPSHSTLSPQEWVEYVRLWLGKLQSQSGWILRRYDVSLPEVIPSASYEVRELTAPTIVINAPAGELRLKPKHTVSFGKGGRVDLYSLPNQYRVRLVFSEQPQD